MRGELLVSQWVDEVEGAGEVKSRRMRSFRSGQVKAASGSQQRAIGAPCCLEPLRIFLHGRTSPKLRKKWAPSGGQGGAKVETHYNFGNGTGFSNAHKRRTGGRVGAVRYGTVAFS